MELIGRFRGDPLVAKNVSGEALAADIPLSFWGGYDTETGTIIDQRHPLAGEIAAGRVLVIPTGRGSCSGSGILLEAIFATTAPAAIIISRIDPIIGLGCVLGDELHQSHPALILMEETDRKQIATGDTVSIDEQGWITVLRHRHAS